LKIDKHLKGLSDRLNAVSGSSNDNNEITRDDDYYLEIGSEPPRFALYRRKRIEQSSDQYRKQTLLAAYDSITQDELDYSLKRKLRISPEQRYQRDKASFLFHDLSCYMKGLSDEEYGCDGAGCVPECRFYSATGRIEDEEVIREHREAWAKLRIVNIDIPD
jgi:hypothetical protein